MVIRLTPPAQRAERRFPVRVRVAVPPHGFGKQLGIIQGWLDAQLGREAYFVGTEAGLSRQDALLVYFLDVEGARAFVNRFACAMAVLPHPKPEDRPS